MARRLNLLLTGGSDFHGDPGHGLEPGSVTLPAAEWERLAGPSASAVVLTCRPPRWSSRCATSSRTTGACGRCASSISSCGEDESVALLGFDQTAAEILVNLITGATLPDSGDVDVFGVSTRNIADPDAWLVEMDRFGILSQRVVLLDAFTVEQNLALPFTLEVEQLSERVRAKVHALAQEVGLDSTLVTSVRRGTRRRRRSCASGSAKALALGPRVLLAEHPNATLPAEAVSRFAADLKRIAAARRLALLVMTADSSFARIGVEPDADAETGNRRAVPGCPSGGGGSAEAVAFPSVERNLDSPLQGDQGIGPRRERRGERHD